MSDYKVGQEIKLINPERCDLMYWFEKDQLFTIVEVDPVWIWVENRCAFKRSQIKLANSTSVSEYKNSNRYKLHKAASATGFSFSKLSRAMGFSDTYISNESKESRFNRRGDLTDKRYNHLIDKIAIAERTLKGNPAKGLYDSIDIETESLCIEKRFELEPKEVTPTFTPKQKIKSKTEVNKTIFWLIIFVLVVGILMLITGIYKSIF
ncbi:MAG TPA: hypothetical protein VIG45_03105 [Erysipelothrix sp.]